MTELFITENVTKSWFCNNQFHRANGPAINYRDGSQYWYRYNQMHRTNGPAVIFTNGYVEYWVNDQQVTEYELMFLTIDN